MKSHKILSILTIALLFASLGAAQGDLPRSDFNPEEKNTDMVKDSEVKKASIIDQIAKQLSVPFSVLNSQDQYQPGETANIDFELDIEADGRIGKSNVMVFELNKCNEFTPHDELNKEDCNDNIISKHVEESTSLAWPAGTTLYNDVSVEVPEEEGSYEVVAYVMQEDPWFVKSEDDARNFIKVKEEEDSIGDGDPSGDLQADIDVSNDNPKVDETVTFEATGSDGDISEYEWDIDGSRESGEVVFEDFNSEGRKSITLTVKDSSGNEDSTSTSIEVERDTAPIEANIDASNNVDVGEQITLDASQSTGEGSLSYTWKINGNQAGTGAIISHEFQEQGSNTVSVTVTDEAGQESTEEMTVFAEFVGPEAGFTMSNKEINAGDKIQLDASPSKGGTYPISEYNWQIGDKMESGQRVTTKVPGEGTKQIKLEVVDSERNSDTASDQVTVNQVYELSGVEMQAPRFVVVEETATFRFVESAANIEAGLQRVEWTVDEEQKTGPEVQKEFRTTGDKQISMTVIDKEGQEVTVDHTVTVQEQDPGIIQQIVTSITDLLGL